eukprot:TRINITY_DN911_c0_g3_i2.p1 TRINITY_DN911_c0_g3~~TRINITY_DN911_c0_g3_i2.p1  ORF type:complete len:548 (+),score=158.08 TRINITY_DN911_c0_g3_i2:612-2255(+)
MSPRHGDTTTLADLVDSGGDEDAVLHQLRRSASDSPGGSTPSGAVVSDVLSLADEAVKLRTEIASLRDKYAQADADASAEGQLSEHTSDEADRLQRTFDADAQRSQCRAQISSLLQHVAAYRGNTEGSAAHSTHNSWDDEPPPRLLPPAECTELTEPRITVGELIAARVYGLLCAKDIAALSQYFWLLPARTSAMRERATRVRDRVRTLLSRTAAAHRDGAAAKSESERRLEAGRREHRGVVEKAALEAAKRKGESLHELRQAQEAVQRGLEQLQNAPLLRAEQVIAADESDCRRFSAVHARVKCTAAALSCAQLRCDTLRQLCSVLSEGKRADAIQRASLHSSATLLHQQYEALPTPEAAARLPQADNEVDFHVAEERDRLAQQIRSAAQAAAAEEGRAAEAEEAVRDADAAVLHTKLTQGVQLRLAELLRTEHSAIAADAKRYDRLLVESRTAREDGAAAEANMCAKATAERSAHPVVAAAHALLARRPEPASAGSGGECTSRRAVPPPPPPFSQQQHAATRPARSALEEARRQITEVLTAVQST